MSTGYRNGAFALGLVVGGGAALNLFLWIDYRAQHQPNQSAYAQDNPNYSQVGNYWDRLIGTFISPSDTFAQWIMAIFTIVVTILVWRTLVATKQMVSDIRRMAIDTREIGEAQVRAYITFESVEVRAKNIGNDVEMAFLVAIKNCGQSPARRIKAMAAMTAGSSEMYYIRDLAAGGSDSSCITVTYNSDRLVFNKGSDTNVIIAVELTATYADVFTKTPTVEEKGFFMAVIDFGESDTFHTMHQCGDFAIVSRNQQD